MLRFLMGIAIVISSLECMASDASRATEAMSGALVTYGASEEIPAQDRIYDRLIGSWTVRAVDILPDGSRHESQGEWHFAYVLEGRAVQDVWIAPARKHRDARTPKTFNRYGTTVRFYQPASRTWQLVWINPVSGALQPLVARNTPAGIVQEGTDSGSARIRWTFDQLDGHAFHWKGERSTDEGKTWELQAEFFGVR